MYNPRMKILWDVLLCHCLVPDKVIVGAILNNPGSPFQSGHTPLQKAAAEGHLDIVKQLLKQGASVDHQDEVVSDGKYLLS